MYVKHCYSYPHYSLQEFRWIPLSSCPTAGLTGAVDRRDSTRSIPRRAGRGGCRPTASQHHTHHGQAPEDGGLRPGSMAPRLRTPTRQPVLCLLDTKPSVFRRPALGEGGQGRLMGQDSPALRQWALSLTAWASVSLLTGDSSGFLAGLWGTAWDSARGLVSPST